MPVRVSIDDRSLDAQPGASLFECAEQLSVRVPTSCNKNGKCRECLVDVSEGMSLLSERTPEEQHLDDGYRLACRACISADTGEVACRTLSRGTLVSLEGAAGLDELAEAVPLQPAVTRRGQTVLLDGEPIAESDGPLLGIAADIGTTTVVLRLVDLESGEVRQVQSFENPQRFGGTNIMARIQYDSNHPGRLLQRTLLGYLGRAIEAFDCDPRSIYELVVAGNSTMRDLFFGLDVHSIGQRPYQSITQREVVEGKRATTSLMTTAKNFRLPICPDARVVSLPIIHGHVGADAAACLLAAGILDDERTLALMDIGTNTELMLHHNGRTFAASCPAGPAFEGGAISCGMPAFPGAVESVTISDRGDASYGVIGDGTPRGICGSGLVELLSELLRTNRMNSLGRLANESDRFVLDDRGVYLTENDVSELLQAKGANVAGLRIVLSKAGIDISDLDRFYLAGAFAYHLDLGAARRIGLVPDLPDDRLMQIGNAAIAGATVALRSVDAREKLEGSVRSIEHVELETDPDFFDHFVEGCMMNPLTTRVI